METMPRELQLQTVAKIANGGRVTIPKRIRKVLDLEIGDDVLISVSKLR
jgi:AbrB family looped-hinge helix DNA binding protein